MEGINKIMKEGVRYVEDETSDIERLESNLQDMKKKWFKSSSIKREIEFLEFYIKEKKNLLNKIKKFNLKN